MGCTSESPAKLQVLAPAPGRGRGRPGSRVQLAPVTHAGSAPGSPRTQDRGRRDRRPAVASLSDDQHTPVQSLSLVHPRELVAHSASAPHTRARPGLPHAEPRGKRLGAFRTAIAPAKPQKRAAKPGTEQVPEPRPRARLQTAAKAPRANFSEKRSGRASCKRRARLRFPQLPRLLDAPPARMRAGRRGAQTDRPPRSGPRRSSGGTRPFRGASSSAMENRPARWAPAVAPAARGCV